MPTSERAIDGDDVSGEDLSEGASYVLSMYGSREWIDISIMFRHVRQSIVLGAFLSRIHIRHAPLGLPVLFIFEQIRM